jgi:anti-sigma factor RsiW
MSSANLIRYARGEASPAELLAFDDHLSECAECRARLPHGSGLTAWAAGLRVPADEEKHLTHDQLIASVENRTSAAEEFEVERHLSLCASCREDAASLIEFRQRLTGQSRTRWWIPAAIAAAVIVGIFLWHRPTPAPNLASARLELSAEWSAADRTVVQRALNDGALPFAPLPADLQAAPGTLRGAPTPESFSLVEPLGAIVYSDRPAFRWQLLPGAVSYRVEIYDDNFQLIYSSPMVVGDSWKASSPLPRGVSYRWQVTASKSGSTVTAPAPPAPEARFQILDSETAKRIARADSQGSAGHLLAAVLFAQSGMRADANRELDALDPAVRDRPEVRKLIDSAK